MKPGDNRTSYSVRYLADLVGGRVEGDAAAMIHGVNRIEFAQHGELTFLSSDKYVKFVGITHATAMLVTEQMWLESMKGITCIIVDDAYRAFVRVMQVFFPPLRMERGLRHAAAIVHPSAHVHETAAIGPGCVVSEGCVIDEGAQLFANVVLYPGCHIGPRTVIHANVTCGAGTVIGQDCIIHPGAVLGSDGFGFLENADGTYDKIPQVGTVRVGNHVEIGANTTIDRAAVGATVIDDGVKLDNLVHIAHNVHVGANTAMAAQVGVSGSTRIGERNRLAGQVGLAGHLTTTDDVIIHAQSGLAKDLTVPGTYFGSPVQEHRVALRMEAALRQLPNLLREFRELQRLVQDLTNNES